LLCRLLDSLFGYSLGGTFRRSLRRESLCRLSRRRRRRHWLCSRGRTGYMRESSFSANACAPD
jgi:hypothetical protein